MEESRREIIAGDQVQILTQSHIYQGVVDFVDKERNVLGMGSGFAMQPLSDKPGPVPVFEVSKGNDSAWEIAFSNIIQLMLLVPENASEKLDEAMSHDAINSEV